MCAPSQDGKRKEESRDEEGCEDACKVLQRERERSATPFPSSSVAAAAALAREARSAAGEDARDVKEREENSVRSLRLIAKETRGMESRGSGRRMTWGIESKRNAGTKKGTERTDRERKREQRETHASTDGEDASCSLLQR